jgi:hypothetical protein
MSDQHEDEFDVLDGLEIEPLSDEALEAVAGGSSSSGATCCSESKCSNGKEDPIIVPAPQ